MRPIAALLFAALLTACASAPETAPSSPLAQPRTVWIVGGEGRAIGQAHFTAAPRGTLIRLEFQPNALPPGWHGLHIHTRGDCSDFAAGFQASGGHLGAGERVRHGVLNPAGPEAGDLPNLFASPNAPFAAEFFSPYTVLGPERIAATARNVAREALLDGDGAALLIHASPDDQVSQPIGGAGARIACAALTPLP
ncbi:MAG TPA: superoxide dismutase family protein [Vitreimonas sp.]|uniref:superoxide dismutase family protein n=1 Tax=Vitreimonas sp. TaxID=3069702 RepID=UPI002D4E0A6E|nr:superoxide dismutase family protein [Vitreimonas sp.]HYD88495.1 superoxide dismutase family protein [Vitreimonas sp.]